MSSSPAARPTNRFNEFRLQDTLQTLSERFEHQARRYPNRLAIKSQGTALSYDELNRAANRLAYALLDRAGAGHEPVALLCGAGLSTTIAALGVLKAGKAFVPLDRRLPKNKIVEILANLEARFLLTDEKSRGAAKALTATGVRSINIELLRGNLSSNPTLALSPESIAYINFTSGTTGEPKGVVWNHRHELFGIRTKTNALHIAAEDRISLLRANNVGAARDMFLALLNGAALLTLDIDEAGLASLPGWLRDGEISVFSCVATVFRHAVRVVTGSDSFPSVRLIHIGGEPVFKADVESYKRCFRDDCLFVNRYSISETQAVSYFFLDKQSEIDEERVPVGYPLDGNEVLILDERGEPLGPRAVGEIAVRSPYLALGYWRQPELTRAKFLAEPARRNLRTYRTGDLGYRLSDGCLVHVGRKDFQAKIRGHRVEPSAVEAALHDIPSVKQAVVVSEYDGANGNRLIAYVVPKRKRAVRSTGWRAQLITRLPAYMVPARFVVLDRLPVSAGGKIDRRALPGFKKTPSKPGDRSVVPRNGLEKLLLEFWRDALNLEFLAVDEDFIELGGDSLQAAQILARVQELFPLTEPLVTLAQGPSIAALAKFILVHEAKPGQAEKIATAYLQIESMSDNEVEKVLRKDGGAQVMANARHKLLATLLEAQGIELPTHGSVEAPKGAQAAPLSISQERLWFLHQLEPQSSVYHISRALRLQGRLDCDALNQAMNALIERHEILRTVFSCVDDRPAQVVAPALELTLELVDLTELAPAVKRAELSRRLAEKTAAPFALERAPLLRADLIKLADKHHVLLLVLHQLVCDGWSMNLLLRELALSYRSLVSDKAPALPEIQIQYRDYAAQERAQLEHCSLQDDLAYWKKRLENNLSAIALATDRPRPALQSFRGGRLPLTINASLAGKLRGVGAEARATMFMVLMAAFNVLLWRYSGQDDISVGFPAANRNARDRQNLIGCFVNTLVLRTDLSGRPTFRQLLKQVRGHCRGALAHQGLPFDRLVEELQRERDLSRNPLFQVMFACQNYPAANVDFPGLKVDALDLESCTSKFDLTLSLTEEAGDLSGFIEYSSDLFDRSTIAGLARHLVCLLRGSAADPDRSIADLPLLEAAERRQILVDWNRTDTAMARNRCVHELFEAQVRRAPDAVALECAGRQLTYRELNGRANRLARYLRKRGIGPEKLVGVRLERSPEMVIALLAILKSGGAYLPLDPHYPRQRIVFMVDDARADLLLTQQKFAADKRSHTIAPLAAELDMQVVCVDRDGPAIEKESAKNLGKTAAARNLAYVIYTSGSTGRPKGAAIEHRNAAAFLQWARRVFSPAGLAGVLASTSICFDLSVFELFAPLSRGGKVILVRDALGAADLIDREDVTLINTVPSAIAELLDAGALPRSVRTVNLAGEPLKPDLVRRLYATGRVEKVYDLYGPSETTTYSTFTLRRADGKATIGRPIANTKIYLLDAALQPVPVGVPGELYIGGAGVARGYLRRPELTAERFLRDPFAKKRGARMYRTGDLARYFANGNIEYLGRADNQVKIRGYRIELGELEAAFAEHPAIRQCVAAVREVSAAEPKLPSNPKAKIQNPKSDRQLVAYIVGNSRALPAASELRDWLRQKLPEFMLPSVFLPVDALPLTPNGKVDRLALPRLNFRNVRSTAEFLAPRTETQEWIAQIWREVLGIERVGIFDNFFDLGGHSLLATRVASRLRAKLRVELALRKLFELPTVAGLARHVEALRRERSGVAIAPIVAAPDQRRAPLSFAQRRLWFLHQLEGDLTAYNMPSAYRVKGSFDFAAFQAALNGIIQRHAALRSAIVEIGGEPAQEILPAVRLAVPVVDLSSFPRKQTEREIARYAAEDAEQPFELQRAPLLRAKVLRLAGDEHVLLLNIHHIVCDGSSLALFFRELAGRYEALLARREISLAPLALQYGDFAWWQVQSLREGELATETGYWKRQLAGLRSIDLPRDYARADAPNYRGVKLTHRLSAELSNALKKLSRTENVTLFMTLLTALQILLSRLSGQEDIVVGSTLAGRNRPEIENIIGFFINPVALRVDLSGNPSVVDLLGRVREVCLAAYTYQDLPFERVVEEVAPERDLGRNPLFQVLFNMADIAEREFQLPGCDVVKLRRAAPGAKFDLVFQAPEFDDGIELTLVYNPDLFSETRAQSMLEQWASLLAQVAAGPAQRIEQFSLLTPAAQALLPDPRERFDDTWFGAVHELVERQAALRPEKVALADDQESWNYRELDQLSNRLAHRLVCGGIRPQDVVAIYAHRDATITLAILAVLKAGAVFTILDPAYPPARLRDYLRIAAPKGMVQMAGAGELPAEIAACVEGKKNFLRVMLPRGKREIAKQLGKWPEETLPIPLSADDPAYIAFTSGSTGEPKGVLCRHGPMTHFLPWQRKTFDLKESDRYALLSGLGYNHLHRDLFTALATGAALYVPHAEELQDPEQLVPWLRRRKISMLHLTPALGRLLQTVRGQTLPALRRIFFGGDLLSRRDAAAMRALAPRAMITSFYGATETQRAVGYAVVDAAASEKNHASPFVPTGRGARDVQLLLLTANDQLAGIGELGELYIRSPHLAAGYLNDRALAAANFIVNPFTGRERDRLYRTGEMGRYQPDGVVEWVGRKERRASIRGFRVELAEVETALQRHPGVRGAALVVRAGAAPEDAQLIAYVACGNSSAVDAEKLRRFLSAQLPHYMIPAHISILERLPLNPSGKIDYVALAKRPPLEPAPDRSYEQPLSAPEATVGKILAALLHLERVGRNEHFFELGGHSLLAAQAAARIRETFGVELDLRAFLKAPTVAGICRCIESSGGGVEFARSQQREEIEL